MKTINLILFFFFLSITVQAFDPLPVLPDSSKYKWVKGEKFLLHTVLPKETWNSLSRMYNISISELMKANIGIIDLQPGQVLNIPIINPNTAKNKENVNTVSSKADFNQNAKPYSVHAGETLFSISKKFNVTVEELKDWNLLGDNIVQEGQILIIRSSGSSLKNEAATYNKQQPEVLTEKPKPDPGSSSENPPIKKEVPNEPAILSASEKPVDKENSNPIADINENPTRSVIPVGKGTSGKTIMQVTESGICSWINDNDVAQNKYYGLHRSAPIGTIIKVTNKMNSKYVFVKIVGVLPDTGENDKSIIKISQAAVDKVGALDAHFQVELSFGVMQ